MPSKGCHGKVRRVAKDYSFSFECFDCPFCGKTITPPHVKRHLTTHNDLNDDEVGIAWIRWLEARDEISAENADRMIAVTHHRMTLLQVEP